MKCPADPYPFPYNGTSLKPENTAFVIIDMQVDFCNVGGYVDQMGYSIEPMQALIPQIKKVLTACRSHGYTIIHTREGHRPDLSDLQANKLWRSGKAGAAIGSAGPAGRILIRGEPGWEIIEELEPEDGEVIIDKPGKGSFYATDLELILKVRGIQNLVLTGVTTDVCVHTTMREANDRGFECLLLRDCTAATDPSNYKAALNMITKQGGVFGAISSSEQFLAAIQPTGILKPLASADTPGVVAVAAQPYTYLLPVERAALINIDFQRDFMYEGGFGRTLGNDVKLLMACVPAAQQLLFACRAAGMSVIHTMEAHKPDLSDLHAAKYNRGQLPQGLRIGDQGQMGRILIRNQPGNGIIEELASIEGEKVIFKPGKGAFYNTDLEDFLQEKGITHLIFAGVTTEICVLTTIAEANDRGYDCLLVQDAAASYFPHLHKAATDMVCAQGGIRGWVADTDAVVKALQQKKEHWQANGTSHV